MATWSDRPLSTSVSARLSKRSCRRRLARGIRWISIGLCVVSLFGPVRSRAQTETLDRILAIVDGQIIMHSDVRAFIDLRLVDIPTGPSQEVDVLTFLIERRVMLDQVDRFVVAEPASDVVARRLDLVRIRLPAGDELDLILDRVGLTPDDLRQSIADDIRLNAYLADRFEIVEEGLREAATADWVQDLVRRAQISRVSLGLGTSP